MKPLKYFIMEALTSVSPKDISIDFTDLEDAKENKTSLKELLDEKQIEYTESGEKISFTIDSNNLDKAKDVYDQLKSYSNTLRTSMKRTNNEQYAQKTLSFEQEVEEINAYIEEVTNQNAEAEKQAEAQKQAEEEQKKIDQEEAEQEKAKQMNTNVNNKFKVKNQKKKLEEE